MKVAEVTKEVRGREVRGSYWGLESYLGHAGGGFGGRKKGGTGSAGGYHVKDGADSRGFCEFYSQVWPKLARRIKKGMGPSWRTWGIGWRGFCSGDPSPRRRWRNCAGPWDWFLVGWGFPEGCKGGGMADLGPSFPAPELLHSGRGGGLSWGLQGSEDGSCL